MACSWWADELSSVFDQFMEAVSGSVDQKIWSFIYKQQHMSGGPYITRWITVLYP